MNTLIGENVKPKEFLIFVHSDPVSSHKIRTLESAASFSRMNDPMNRSHFKGLRRLLFYNDCMSK